MVVIVQLLSHVWLFATPWTVGYQASRSFTISESLLKLVHWVSDAIQPSCPLLFPSPPAFKLSQHQGSFPVNWLFTSGGQVLELQLQHVFPMNSQDWFPLGLTGLISMLSRYSQESSQTQFKSIISSVLSLIYGPTFTSVHDYWKNHSFDYRPMSTKWYLCFLILCLGLS